MTSTNIGDIGELKTMCKLIELGIPIYKPLSNNEKVDLVADFGGGLKKIQIKTSIKADNGKMVFEIACKKRNHKKNIREHYSDNDVDFYVCYNMSRDKLFLIPISDAPKDSITIRYEKVKYPKCNYEEEYLLENKIKEYI